MGSEWKRYLFEDCMDAIIDYRGKTPQKTSEGIPLITAKIIKDGCIQPVSEFIAEEDYDSWMRRGIPEPGDVVLTTEAPLGEVAQLDDRKIALAQRVITLRGKKGFLDNTFLKYLLLSNDIQHQLDGRGTGTTVKGIKQSELRKIELPIPDYPIQKSIAHVLGTLDQKIQLNRQTNQTLEQMAQALFKSWFVDFDPVIDNALAAGNPVPPALQKRAAIRAEQLKQQHVMPLGDCTAAAALANNPEQLRALFPSEFEHTEELGWVPKGWGVLPLSDIATLVTKSVQPNKQPDKEWIHFSIPAFDNNETPSTDLGNDIKSGKYMVPKSSVLVSKLNPETQRIWVPKSNDLSRSVCSTEFMPFVPRDKRHLPFLNSLLRSEQAQTEICNRATGSTGSRQRVKPKEIAAMELLFPPEELISLYSQMASAFLAKYSSTIDANRELEKLRDTLLPKLISGELRLPDADTAAAALSE